MSVFSGSRTVQLEEDELPYRKSSSATIRSEGTGTQYYAKVGHSYICLDNNAALEYYSTQWVIINMALNVYFQYVNLYNVLPM